MKLADIISTEAPVETPKVKQKSSGLKLADIISGSEPSTERNKYVETGRALAGKALVQIISGGPTDIGRQIAEGRLMNPDPLANASEAMLEGALDSATFGIPKAVIKQLTKSESIEPSDKKSYEIGKVIGLLAPTKVAVSAVSKIPQIAGRTVLKDIARGSAEGAAVGFTYSPDEFLDIKQRIKQAVVGATGGAIAVPVARGLQNLGRVAFKSADFAKKVRSSLFEAKRVMGDTFEKQLDDLIEKNPSKVVNLEEPILRLKEAMTTNSRIATDLANGARRAGLRSEGKSLVERLLENPESAREMTLNQTRELRRIVNEVPSIKAAFKKGKFAQFSDTDIDLLDFTDNIKQKQLSAFPEMGEINARYSEGLTKYNSVKDKFKVGQLLDNMTRNFGDKEVQSIVKQLLPKEIIQEIGGYRAAAKFLNIMKWLSIAGATGVVAGEVGGRVFAGRGGISEGF